MEKKMFFLVTMLFMLVLIAGCSTPYPKSANSLIMDAQKSGVLSAQGQSITIYGVGRNEPTHGYFQSNSEREKVSRKNAEAAAKKQLENIVTGIFDDAREKYNSKYQEKQISDDNLASMKSSAVKKAQGGYKIIYTFAEPYNAIYVAISEINLADLGLPGDMPGILVSTAEQDIKAGSEEQDLYSKYRQSGSAIDGNQEAAQEQAEQETGQNAPENSSSASSETESEVPFWAADNNKETSGVIAVSSDAVTVFAVSFMQTKRGNQEACDKKAKEKIKDFISSLINTTTDNYLNVNSSGQADCDALKSSAGDVEADAAENSPVIGNYTKKLQVLFSTFSIYHSLAVYKIDTASLKMQGGIKDSFISTAQGMMSASASEYMALVKAAGLPASTASASVPAETATPQAGQTAASAGGQPAFQQKVRVILNDDTIVTGTFVGQKGDQIFIQQQADKAEIIKTENIQDAFNADSGEEINFNSNTQNTFGK